VWNRKACRRTWPVKVLKCHLPQSDFYDGRLSPQLSRLLDQRKTVPGGVEGPALGPGESEKQLMAQHKNWY
jgi:hypothetical protein